jgi:magnesium chelatase family protein
MVRISGPLLDRIDLHIEVPTVDARQHMRGEPGESSESIRTRVIAARDRQLSRYRTLDGVSTNADLSARGVREFCAVDEKSASLLHAAIQRLRLSTRAYHRNLETRAHDCGS